MRISDDKIRGGGDGQSREDAVEHGTCEIGRPEGAGGDL